MALWAVALTAYQTYSSSKASEDATDAGLAAAREAGNTELEMFYKSLEQMEPWTKTGGQSLGYLNNILGLGPRQPSPYMPNPEDYGFRDQIDPAKYGLSGDTWGDSTITKFPEFEEWTKSSNVTIPYDIARQWRLDNPTKKGYTEEYQNYIRAEYEKAKNQFNADREQAINDWINPPFPSYAEWKAQKGIDPQGIGKFGVYERERDAYNQQQKAGQLPQNQLDSSLRDLPQGYVTAETMNNPGLPPISGNALTGEAAGQYGLEGDVQGYINALTEYEKQNQGWQDQYGSFGTFDPESLSVENYQKSPYYDFLMKEQTNAIANLASAKGQLRSGNTLKALQERGQNLAATDYGNWLNQQQLKQGMKYESLNPYLTLAGLGQISANQGAGYAMQTGTNLANNAMYGGYLQGQNAMNQANIQNNAITNLANLGMGYYNNMGGYGYY